MDLEEIGINAGSWVDSAQDKNYRRSLVNAALNLRVPKAIEVLVMDKCLFWKLALQRYFMIDNYFPWKPIPLNVLEPLVPLLESSCHNCMHYRYH